MPPRSSLHPPLSGQVSLDLRETDAYALNMSSKSMRGPLPPLFRLSIFPRERDILSSYAFIASFGRLALVPTLSRASTTGWSEGPAYHATSHRLFWCSEARTDRREEAQV